jgi:hypothetical protein
VKFFISQYWKIIIGLISIFIGGLGFGGVLESLRHRTSTPPPTINERQDQDWIDSTLASLDASLTLTESQKSEIRPLIETAAREIQLSRESALIKFELSLLELHRAIAPKLEAEQQQQLHKSEQSLEKRIQQRTENLLDHGRSDTP